MTKGEVHEKDVLYMGRGCRMYKILWSYKVRCGRGEVGEDGQLGREVAEEGLSNLIRLSPSIKRKEFSPR